ncbi:YbaK/EbsC family protein [Streptomyces sp. NPDC000070]|uniref:YbaK/EbsC family protein n=1 Tax=Streptomyces sp. NPDC000070 TaxID=3154240 RepID=UPI003333C4DB
MTTTAATDAENSGAHPRFVEALGEFGLEHMPPLGADKVTRAKADVVRETTGYAIGGVPPFGHRTKTRVLADRSLFRHDVVWAAAGTPYTVFPMAPHDLVTHAGGTLVDVRELPA